MKPRGAGQLYWTWFVPCVDVVKVFLLHVRSTETSAEVDRRIERSWTVVLGLVSV